MGNDLQMELEDQHELETFEVSFGNLTCDDDEEEAQADFNEGMKLLTEGDHVDSIELFQRAADLDKDLRANSLYNIACAWALSGKKDKAFEALNVAVKGGFVDSEHILEDDDLKSLRDDERFETVIEFVEELEKSESLVSEAIQRAGEEALRCRGSLVQRGFGA